MRTFIRKLTIGLSFLAGSFGVAGGAFAYQHYPTQQQPVHEVHAPAAHGPQHFHGHPGHPGPHDFGMTRRQAYHAGFHDIAANFRWVDRNHDGLVTRAEIAAFRHWQARPHWQHR